MIYIYVLGQLKEENKQKRVHSEDATIEFASSSSSQKQAEECIYNLEK